MKPRIVFVEKVPMTLEQKLEMFTAELNMSQRTINMLEEAGFFLIKDVIRLSETELSEMKNFGRSSLNELKAALFDIELKLREPLMASGSAFSDN